VRSLEVGRTVGKGAGFSHTGSWMRSCEGGGNKGPRENCDEKNLAESRRRLASWSKSCEV